MNENKDERLFATRAAGQKIDPDTAQVHWEWGETFDPYRLGGLPDELHQIERLYFARAPGTDLWIEFGDLPEATRKTLWERVRRDSSSCDLFGGNTMPWDND